MSNKIYILIFAFLLFSCSGDAQTKTENENQNLNEVQTSLKDENESVEVDKKEIVDKNIESNKSDKRNVLDYYKLLPENILDNENMKAKVVIEDIKNGYLKIEGAFEGYTEVALFRKEDKSGVLVVGKTSCGPVCGTDLNAYEYVDDKMKDVTKDVMPSLTEEEIRAEFRKIVEDPDAEMVSFIYELPREGRIIKILDDESGKLIYSLNFEKDKFVITK